MTARLQAPRVAAVCYHDLRDDDDFTTWLRVSRDVFDRHLTTLKTLGRFISPDDLDAPERLDRERLNLLLTFDDGYTNNLRLALPLLEAHRVPGLFFVSTQPMIEQRPFRADRLLTPVQVLRLDRLDLRAFGMPVYRFHPVDGPRRWEDLGRLLVDLKRKGNDDHPEVAAVLDHMEDEYGAVLAEHLPRLRPISPAELRQLAASPWVRIGSHGHQHRILTRLDDATLRDDLDRSRRILADHGGPPTHLAYPNGDGDERVARLAGEAGYTRAWTTSSGSFWTDAPRMHLPRIMVGGYDDPGTLRYMVHRALLGRRVR